MTHPFGGDFDETDNAFSLKGMGYRNVSLYEAAVLLRHQGRLLSAQKLLEEAKRKADAAHDGDALVQIGLSEALCQLDRVCFTEALDTLHGAEAHAKQFGLSTRQKEIQEAIKRAQRLHLFWWIQAIGCVAIVGIGLWWNPIPLNERLMDILPNWTRYFIPLMQFGGVSLTLAQILGLFFLTSAESRHLAHRFRFPHLVLLGFPLVLCLAARFLLPGGTHVPFGLLIGQAYLVLLPLALLVVAIPLVERWRGGWKPITELMVIFLVLTVGLQMPSGTELLVISDQIADIEKLQSIQTQAWLHTAQRLRNLGYDETGTLLIEANALADQERDREAVLKYEQILKSEPDNMESLNNLAWLLLTSKDESLLDPQRGKDLVVKALPLGGKDEAYVMDTYAEALFQNGEIEKAIEVEHQSLELMERESWIVKNTYADHYHEQLEKFENARNKQ